MAKRAKIRVAFPDDARSREFDDRHDAEVYAQNHSRDGDVIGIEHGKSAKFYKRRGRTLYPISVEAAAFELAMMGSNPYITNGGD